jgi:4-carboxymuconolactone decarboxylase
MYNYLRFGTQLPVRQKELAVLIAARYNSSKVQWSSHGTNARRIGVEPKIFDVMASGGPLDGLAEKDAVVIAMGREMFGDKHVSSETFARAMKLFGRKGVTDLAGLMAFYEFLYISSNVTFDLEGGNNQPPVPPLPARPVPRMMTGAPATLPADINAESRARVPHVKREDLDAETQKVWDLVSNPTAKNLPAPLGMWLNSPEMAQVVLPSYQYLRYGNGLGTRLTEVAILTAARETDCQFQWTSHEPMALRGGVQQPVIDVIKHRRSLDSLDEKDAFIVKFGRELLHDHHVTADTFARGQKLFGTKGVTDLAGLMAFYEFLYLSSNAMFDIQMPPGQQGLLPMS